MEEPLRSKLDDAIHLAREVGAPQIVDFTLEHNGTSHAFEARIYAESVESAKTSGLVITILDVSETRAHEMTLRALMREVSHRSKNLLAIVQSVAMQTARHTGTIEDFLLKFRGRLHALSSTQDLVTDSDWQGTRFHDLVTAQLSRTGVAVRSDPGPVQLKGLDPIIGPNTALHLGLALHELATNSVLHGALGDGHSGSITISLRVADADRLEFVWHELIRGNDTRPTQAKRFGTLVLEKVVPLSVSGSASYDPEPQEVRYELSIPAQQLGK
ncbi:hypothetical protein GCM10007989_11490 [Devosia pacifica]|uniref:histidine kinase n=1 Tax=Devosia pacifica TaxID=1335967 RepID=A0A918S2Q3_9HYPH|nr:hypothetical protein GCM10007989_11490 [Devosia pacifica]